MWRFLFPFHILLWFLTIGVFRYHAFLSNYGVGNFTVQWTLSVCPEIASHAYVQTGGCSSTFQVPWFFLLVILALRLACNDFPSWVNFWDFLPPYISRRFFYCFYPLAEHNRVAFVIYYQTKISGSFSHSSVLDLLPYFYFYSC